MTKENAEKLYKHYMEVGYKEAAENMLEKYPEFVEAPKTEKTKKSKD